MRIQKIYLLLLKNDKIILLFCNNYLIFLLKLLFIFNILNN